MAFRTPAAGRPDRQAGTVINQGDRVELVNLTHDYLRFGLTAGEHGTVAFTDSLGTIHIRWDSGRRAGILAGETALIRKIPSE